MTKIKETNGDAVVEATILFPIMIMVFAALILLAIYLPTRAALQHATQYAATVIAVEDSDTWLFYDEDSMEYRWETDKSKLPDVHTQIFASSESAEDRGIIIGKTAEERGLSAKNESVSFECHIENSYIYKEVIVTATRVYKMPLNLSFIGFPETIPITVTSRAVMPNGEETVRNIDIAVNFAQYAGEKFGLSDVAEKISGYWSKAASALGW